MRNYNTTGLSAVGFGIGIGGVAVPVVFPDIEPWVAKGMLSVAAACLILALILWFFRPKEPDGGGITRSPTTYGPSSPSILGDGAHVHYGNVTNINVPPGRDFVTPRYDKERAEITSLNRDRPWIVSVLTRDEESSKFANQVITYLQKIGLPLEQVHPGFIAISGDQVFDLAVHIDARTIIIGARS